MAKPKKVDSEMTRYRLQLEMLKRTLILDQLTRIVPAFVFGQAVPGTDGGKTDAGVRVDPNSSEGLNNATFHELMHFMLNQYNPYTAKGTSSNDMHHALGGILGRPFGNPDINNNILKVLKRYLPTDNANTIITPK